MRCQTPVIAIVLNAHQQLAGLPPHKMDAVAVEANTAVEGCFQEFDCYQKRRRRYSST